MIPAPIRLPDPRGRMTPERKQLVVIAIRRGEITRQQALSRYRLSDQELRSWIDRHARHGLAGLSVNRLQELGR